MEFLGLDQPSRTATRSSSRMTSSSSPSTLTSVPEYLPNSTLSPALTAIGRTSVFLDLAAAHGDHFALDGLFGRGVGDDDAAGGFGFRLEALDDDTVVQWTK